MITLSVVTKVIPRKHGEFLQSVRYLTSDLDRIGNSGKPTLYQEVEDQSVFNLVCELETKEDLKKLLSSEEFKALFGAFKLLCEKSKIRCKYNCRNWPRHKCATHEPLGREKLKKVDRKARVPKSLPKKINSRIS